MTAEQRSLGIARAPWWLVAGASLGALATALPLVFLLLSGFSIEAERFWQLVWRERTLYLLSNSAALTVGVAGTCVVLGTATAWALDRVRIPLRGLFVVAAAVPLAIPSYVAAFGWFTVDSSLRGFWPSWMILTAISVPLVTLPVLAALRNADYSLVEISRSYGRDRVRAWLQAMFPQVAPAAAAGGLLVALYTLSEFGGVAAMRYEVFTTSIMASLQSFGGNEPAYSQSLILLAMALIVIGGERMARNRGRAWRVGSGVTPNPPRAKMAWASPLLMLMIVAPGVVGFVIPVSALFARFGVTGERAHDWGDVLQAAVTSLSVAALGALIAILIALPIGAMAARYRGLRVSMVETLGFSAHALPGVVLAIGFTFFALRFAQPLYLTFVLLVFASGVMFVPKAIGATRTSIAQAPPTLTDVARSLGMPRVRAWIATVGRMATPGVAAGGLLVALTIMKELPATLMLRPIGTDTLATRMWTLMDNSQHGVAVPYAVALIVLAAIPAAILSRYSIRGEG